MKSHEFSDLARWLFDERRNPASFRTSTSRAYYGALHLAIEILRDMNITISRTVNKHIVVPDILQNSGDAEVVRAGALLKLFHATRNIADYDLDDPYADTDEMVQAAFYGSRAHRRQTQHVSTR